MSANISASENQEEARARFLFIACFASLVATSFAFIIRVMAMADWQAAFDLSETQKGEIFGAGLWPFGISIVLFSLVVDSLGYGRAMIFAFLCHLASTIILVTAKGYWGLYAGSLLNGLAAGTVEAVINPAVATLFPKNKTKMLTILHAGWPGGMVLGGLLIMVLSAAGITNWQVKVAIILLPVITYGILLLRSRFPVSERVAAGVPYREMLAEPGAVGALLVSYLVCAELARVFGWPSLAVYIAAAAVAAAHFIYTRSLGRPLYLFLLAVMVLLAITELGVDSWTADLMGPAMGKLGLAGGWVLVYTATVMMILRFCIGPIERALRPLGVLLMSAAIAAIGLYTLSRAEGIFILLCATLYGAGKTFFWPVTLGLVSERFPRGGALTLNAIAGVGMLSVGILGNPLLGYWQDTLIDAKLQAHPEAHRRLMEGDFRQSIFGAYRSLNQAAANEIRERVALYEALMAARQENGGKAGTPEEICAQSPRFAEAVRATYRRLFPQKSSGDLSAAEMIGVLRTAGHIIAAAEYEHLAQDRRLLEETVAQAKQGAMSRVAILPAIMALCYLVLIFYFRSRGGYRAVDVRTGQEVESEGQGH